LTILALASSCRNKAKKAGKAPIVTTTVVDSASKASENKPSLKLSDVAQKYSSLNRPWETFSAKFKANYQDSGRSLSFTMNCRSMRSKATYLLVQGPLGILVAEVLVRPDSFYLDNRIEQSFTKGPSTAGADYSGLPLDFNLLQTLVTGIPTLRESEVSRIDSAGGLFRFQMTPNNREMSYSGTGSFPSTVYLYGKEQTAVISLSDPKLAEGIAEEIPSTKKLALGNPQGRELMSLTLHSQTAKFNLPVEIPSRLVPRSGAKVTEIR
jgi:hypothetical protein